jgi:hypothetical protein
MRVLDLDWKQYPKSLTGPLTALRSLYDQLVLLLHPVHHLQVERSLRQFRLVAMIYKSLMI